MSFDSAQQTRRGADAAVLIVATVSAGLVFAALMGPLATFRGSALGAKTMLASDVADPLTTPVADSIAADVASATATAAMSTTGPVAETTTTPGPATIAVVETASSATPTTLRTATVIATAATAATAMAASTPARVAARAAPGAGVPILMYHYIRTNPDPNDRIGYGLSVPASSFASQMAFLTERGFRTVTMRDLAAYVGTGRVPEEKTVAITFDDGYRDFFEAGWPDLKRHGFTATVFMITALIDNWRYLSVSQLQELDRAGVEIGSHSVTHADLPTLSAERLTREVEGSRATLERIVRGPVVSFCYPSGKHSALVRTSVLRAGFSTAVTVEPGLFRGKEDRFAIPRVRVYGGMGLGQFARSIGEAPPDPTRWSGQIDDRPAPKRP